LSSYNDELHPFVDYVMCCLGIVSIVWDIVCCHIELLIWKN